jgi:hypothetical protein
MSLARVVARLRSRRGRAYVLGILVALLTLVPLAHTSPPDAMWIAGIYDAGDFDEVVWMLIGTDFVGSPVRLAGTAPLLLISVFTGVGISPVVAGGRLTIRPRSPPRI